MVIFYRRPIDIVSGCNDFSAVCAKTLTLFQKKKRSIYISEDIVLYLRTLYRLNFIQNLVFQLAIIANGTITLIHNIFTNHIDNSTSGVFTNEISDHQMIYTYFTESFLNNNTAKYIDIESNTNKKLDNFLLELQSIE